MIKAGEWAYLYCDVYGDCTAKQVKRSRAVTPVEIVIVDAYGNERLLDIITRTK